MEGLEGLGADVTTKMINGLLLARAPRVLDEGSEEYSTLVDCVSGAVTEVAPLVGDDPQDGPKRKLAVRAIAYLAAAELEAALFPEQQGPGDVGRASYLLGRYNSLRSQLSNIPDSSDGSTGTTGALPRGNFPPSNRYPDDDRRGLELGNGWRPGFRRNVFIP